MKENSFEAFHGLAKSNPLLAFVTTIFLFSLAGIPLTGGFFAKYYMLNALYAAGAGLLVNYNSHFICSGKCLLLFQISASHVF